MSILEVSGLTHRFGDKLLYKDAGFTLLKGEHLGIVGQNGAGKSTLLKLLDSEIIPDAGQIVWYPNLKIGVLNQYAEVDGALTVLEYLHTAFSQLYQIEEEMHGLYQEAAQTGSDETLIQAAHCQTQLETANFYEIESEINRAVFGLGLDAFGVDTPIQSLSGGQREKVILAKLLLERADVLLLDEPTNFLDQEHIAWLAEYLTKFPGAFLIVSHDFEFLEKTTNSICDLEFGTIRKYHGTYSDFLRQKEHLREDYVRQYTAQQKKIEQTEEFIRRNKAGVNSKIARGRQKQLDRIERIAPPSFNIQPVIRFQESPMSGSSALSVQELVVGYDAPLLPKLRFSVENGQKLVITGFNGIGKSTFLKTLVGELSPLDGEFQFSEAVKVGYYEQELRWEEDLTPIQIISRRYPKMNEKQIRRQLSLCGVKSDSVLQTIQTLSGGEQSKVKLCRLLLSPCNFLLLDEPTNHLDADTKEALKKALVQFSGAVIMVSHEQSFYQGWADQVLRIDEAD